MSGSDLRAFLAGHRAGTFNLSKSGAGGVGSGRGIKRVDYSGLLAQANAHRATAHLQETKLKSLRKQRRELKEGSLLHLHQEVWHHEWARLVSEGLRVEGEVEEWRCDILAGVGGETCDWVKEISSYMATLYQDEGKMAEQESLHGIQQLQIELKRWLNISACPEAERGPLPPPWTHLQEALDAVKQEVTQVQDTLQEQAMSLWHDLVCYQDTHLNGNSESWTREDPVGNLEYSDTRFKQSLVKEFDNLNSHYQLILQQLERRHEQAIRSTDGGWPEEHCDTFTHIMDQYPTSLGSRRRTAYLDRLAREFPQYTRQQLVAHETWVLSMRHYHQQKLAYLRDWNNHYKELQGKVKGALTDYMDKMAVREAGQVAMETHAALCKQLHEKVSKWRKEKEEESVMLSQQQAALQLEQQMRREKEEEKRKKKQKATQMKLSVYQKEKEEKWEEEVVWFQRLREETRKLRKVEAKKGQGRVKYRREQFVEKLSRQKECLEQHAEEEREKEKRLEALREQVKVHVTSDPKRVFQHTASVQARVTSDPYLPIKHPLFPLHGFPAHKVTSDPRIRLEEALRKAGLHESTYARQAMAAVQAHTAPPRPDQQSSIFHNS